MSIKTGCPYCGVGCGLVAEVRDGRLHAVRGDDEHPVNRGRTCRKPLALPEASRTADRAVTPQLRGAQDERFRDASWDEALDHVAERLLAIRAEHGPEAIAFYISGQLLTEDYYAVNKLAKGYLGTNNVDSNSRLCMSSAVAAYDATFGADGPPPAYADLEATDCILLLGSNASACHPILWGRIRAAQERGATLIVVDPRRTDSAAAADIHFQIKPGTDLALLNALIAIARQEGRRRRDRRGARRRAEWTPERAADDLRRRRLRTSSQRRRAFADADGAMALWSMGANQSVEGVGINRALLNLCVVDRPDRPARRRSAVADGPAERDGRARGRRARAPAARLPQGRAGGAPARGRGALGRCRPARSRPSPACRRPTCSTRSRTAASRPSGSAAPTPRSACPTPSARARRCATPSS